MNKENKNIIKVNRELISKDQIRNKEDFGRVLKGHQKITKRPVYKQKKFYFILFLIVIVSFLIYLSEQNTEEINNETTTEQNTSN